MPTVQPGTTIIDVFGVSAEERSVPKFEVLGSNLGLENVYFLFSVFYYFLYRIDRRPNFVKKCEIHHMLLNKIRMFFLCPGLRKKLFFCLVQ